MGVVAKVGMARQNLHDHFNHHPLREPGLEARASLDQIFYPFFLRYSICIWYYKLR